MQTIHNNTKYVENMPKYKYKQNTIQNNTKYENTKCVFICIF